MNRIFKLVWNRSLHCWVVASELTKSRGKKSAAIAACVLMVAMLLPNGAHAAGSGTSPEPNEATNDIGMFNTTVPYFIETGSLWYVGPRTRAEENARKEAEAKARARAEAEENARKEAEAEAQAIAEAEENARKEAEAKARARAEAEENARKEAEAKARARAEAEENARKEAEAKAQARAEAEENARKEAEAEAQAIAEAEENARKEAEAKAQARAEAEENARKEAEAKAQAIAEAEENARKEAEAKARAIAEAEENARKEAEAKAQAIAEAEENARKEAEAKAQAIAEAEENARKEAEAKAQARVEAAEAEPEADAGDEQADGQSGEQNTHEETPAASTDEPAIAPAPSAEVSMAPLPEKAVVVVAPQAGSYNSNAWAANTMFQMNLNDRLGSYFQGEGDPHQGSAWIRYSGSHSALKDESGQLRTKGDRNTVMMGIDMLADSTNDRDQVTIGVMGGYGHYDGKTSSSLAGFGSKGKVEGYGLGLYGTYQQNAETEQGVYVDTWLLWNQFDNRVKGDDLPREKYKSKGMTASLELGYNAKIAEHNNVKYVLQPHAQLTYQHVRSDNFTDSNGTRIEFLNGSRIQTTVGLRAAAHVPTGLTSVITPHIEANWLHSTKGYGVRMNNADARMDSGRNAGQLKLGVEGNINQRLSLNVEVFHNQGNAGYHETGGNLMAKYRY